MLTEERWALLEPLVEACRPNVKVAPRHLRRTMAAIIWRHENRTKWRAIPAELGPWWMAAQTFIRWSQLGVWERLMTMAQERGITLGISRQQRLPRTPEGHNRIAQKATEAAGSGGTVQALGRSHGGFGTKARVIADSSGRAAALALVTGRTHELRHAVPLLTRLPDVPLWVVSDRGCISHAFRQHIGDLGVRPSVPSKRNEALRLTPVDAS